MAASRAKAEKTRTPRRATPRHASVLVQREWLRRVQAEYRSAAITQHLTHWLIQLGAPPALIREGLRIVDDELRHAELAHRVYVRAGGSDVPGLVRETLELTRCADELEHDVARVAIQSFCLGETAAVRLFHRMRVRCTVPVARAALDRVLRDEVRHRDFGWALLGWLLALPDGPALRRAAAAALPAMIAGLRTSYGDAVEPARDAPERLIAADMRWGLMPSGDYRAAVTLCIDRDLRPRFDRLAIGGI